MFKQSPSRNHRSKGLKVKHVLQICVLLAVCVWLIYQVKHSHEKRREFETKDEKVAGKVQINGELLRFGRKDIPRISEIVTDGEKREEEDEEKEGEEEENKHEDDELEREDVRLVETEEERGGGDDELDEHEPEKTGTESEHEEEEEVDEDKEREENEGVTEENLTESEENKGSNEGGHAEAEDNEDAVKEGHSESEEMEDVDKEDHGEQEVDSDDPEHVAERTNTREAQEVLYQADDASSEVAHDVQSIPERENVTTGRSNEIQEMVNFGQEHKTTHSDNADKLTKPKVQPRDVKNGASGATIVNSSSSNPRSTQGTISADELIKPEVKLAKPDNAEEFIKSKVNLTNHDDVDSSRQSSTLPEINSNSSVAGGEHPVILNSYGTETTLDSHLSQNGTIELPGDKKPNLPDNSTVKLKLATDDKKLHEAAANANKAENVNTNTGESLSSHNTTLSDGTNDEDSFVDNKNKGGKAGSENQHDPIDASDTNTLTQEAESRLGSETLPEITTEVQKTEETVAE